MHVAFADAELGSHFASFIAQVLQNVAPGRYQKHEGLRFEPIERHRCGCCAKVSWRNDCRPDQDSDAFVTTDGKQLTVSDYCYDSLLDTYKALRRRPWRRVLQRHQRCIASAATQLGRHMRGAHTVGFCPHALAFIQWRMLWEGSGTPLYLLRRQHKELFGILGWHLARPAPSPPHWSAPTKAWITRHLFASAVIDSFDRLVRWAEQVVPTNLVPWEQPTSPVDQNCLWAVAGNDCHDAPAVVYLHAGPRIRFGAPQAVLPGGHWETQQRQIAQLRRPEP